MSLATQIIDAMVSVGNDMRGVLAKVAHVTVTAPVDLDALKAAVDDLGQATTLQGEFSAAAGVFPGGGAAQVGYTYIASDSGAIDGVAIATNDQLIAVVDNASTTTFAGNWHHVDNSANVTSVNGRSGIVVGLQEAAAVGDTDHNFLNDYITARDT